ncbi:SAV_2336 N-terminal domain-related protein [Streptomyces sp. NPDC058373]|uniref:SAV_2336 N-terminal domain-related protein n=1 Tax=Streptomyces sp. NPDC058373 TaxID=3346465 RepID=UPI003659A687
MTGASARHGPDGRPDRAPAPPRRRPSTDPLPELVARLRGAGLDIDAEHLLDALWLAHRTGRAPAPADARPAGAEAEPEPGPDAAQGGVRTVEGRAGGGLPPPAERRTVPSRPAPAPVARVPLHPRPADGGPGSGPAAGALPVGVPAAPVLASPLGLQRALRPLQAYRTGAAPRRQVLDEAATAELTARAGGLVLPVFRPVTRRDALLQLVLDASGSMGVWQRLFDELREVFGGLGAFRDLHVRYLHATDDGRAAVSRSPRRDGAPLHSTDRLVDATGRRVTLLVSDCAGPLWHTGAAHRTLHRLAGQGPVAVLQPLPQRLWPRTRLQVTFGELRRGQGVSGAGLLKVVSDGPPPPPGARPVPVLPPTAAALGSWARLLSGTGPARTPGAVGWVSAAQEPARPVRPRRALTPLQLVSRFRSTASPAAGRLAVCLAAAPLNLPVMQLVQRTMLPDSGPAELAEVLLSGLLVRADEPGAGDQEQWYDFVPGVRQALLGPLGRDEAMLVLKHCSEYVEQRFGKGGPNFPALAYAQLGRDTGTGPLPASARSGRAPGRGGPADSAGGPGESGEESSASSVPQPFAEVAADVLERFMTVPLRPTASSPGPLGEDHPALAAAADLGRRYEEQGMVQYLMDAVQLLRGAAENTAGPPAAALWARYAREVLRLWRVQGGRELLTEARAAAERAATDDEATGHAGHRDVLAATLHATADDRRRRGERHEALDLLRRADREYAVACAAPGLGPDQALRLTLERVRALETQWRLGGDSSLLQAAVGMLEAFTDIWPDQHRRPPALALAHGRTLLRLAGTGPPGDQAHVHSRQAARALRTVVEADDPAPEAGGLAPADREAALLDLADALLRAGPEYHQEAADRVEAALHATPPPSARRRSALLTRAGRVHTARYEESGDPAELTRAAARFEEAAPGIPRDAPAHAALLAEWGEALLRRALLGDGTRHERLERVVAAVRVLRGCRVETPRGDRAFAHRLVLLGRGLMARHRLTGDRVDLREGEHLLGLAAQEAVGALESARCLLELGQARFEAAQTLARPTRLDEAADAFRAAADAARRARAEAASERAAAESATLGAQAEHWRGMTYEAAGRPRAAREAYGAAHRAWGQLPPGTRPTVEPTPRQTAQRLAELA